MVGPNLVITNAALHIDGTLQVTSSHPPGYDQPEAHGADFNNGGPSTCGTAGCHGTALNGGASNVACTDCHANWQTTCDFCHGGTDNATGAPPLSLLDQVSRSIPAIGAHTEHVEASSTHPAYACSFCHINPSSALSPGHVEGNLGAEVLFSSRNSAATYNGSSCSNLYCHGNGRTNTGSASWTSTTALGCDGCHVGVNNDGSGLSGRHKKHIAGENMKCNECHLSVLDANQAIIGPALHVNGVKEVEMEVGGTWNAANKTCSGLPGGPCHGTERW